MSFRRLPSLRSSQAGRSGADGRIAIWLHANVPRAGRQPVARPWPGIYGRSVPRWAALSARDRSPIFRSCLAVACPGVGRVGRLNVTVTNPVAVTHRCTHRRPTADGPNLNVVAGRPLPTWSSSRRKRKIRLHQRRQRRPDRARLVPTGSAYTGPDCVHNPSRLSPSTDARRVAGRRWTTDLLVAGASLERRRLVAQRHRGHGQERSSPSSRPGLNPRRRTSFTSGRSCRTWIVPVGGRSQANSSGSTVLSSMSLIGPSPTDTPAPRLETAA
jgi:hypothetical protein